MGGRGALVMRAEYMPVKVSSSGRQSLTSALRLWTVLMAKRCYCVMLEVCNGLRNACPSRWNWLHLCRPRNIIMGSTDTDIEELENATYKYLIGEQTEKMWQRLKGMWVSSLLGLMWCFPLNQYLTVNANNFGCYLRFRVSFAKIFLLKTKTCSFQLATCWKQSSVSVPVCFVWSKVRLCEITFCLYSRALAPHCVCVV